MQRNINELKDRTKYINFDESNEVFKKMKNENENKFRYLKHEILNIKQIIEEIS